MSMRLLRVLMLSVSTLLAVEVLAEDAWIAITPEGAPAVNSAAAALAPDLRVLSSTDRQLDVALDVPGLGVGSRTTKGGDYTELNWPAAAFAGEVGEPRVPVVRRLFLAPPGATVTIQVVPGDPVQIDAQVAGQAIWVIPQQAPVAKLPGALEAAPFDFNERAYATNADWPAERAVVQALGVVRHRQLFLLEIRPVAYNPVAQQLQLWPQMQVSIRFEGNAAPPARLSVLPGLQHEVLNPALLGGQRLAASRGGNYVIIVASDFASSMAEFEAAKIAQGFDVTTWVTHGDSNSQIKSYIQGLWDSPSTRPDYILLVGDTDTIPHWIGGGAGSPPTDLPYACMDGSSDWFPDIAIGRFPVRTTAQLEVMIGKTLLFEEGLFGDTGYTSRAVFMASQDNYTVSEGTHNYCIDTHMTPNNIESDKLYCATHNATTQQVRDAFDDGRLFGIYSGHGSETSWADGPPFSQSDVNNLTNLDNYSWVCSFACVTGNFAINECFMETWVRSPDKAAVAAWGSSVNSYWTEDDVLQCRLFDCLYWDYVRELGPLYNLTKVVYAGEMGGGSTTRRYFEMYNLMGDPSLYIPDAEAALRVTPGDDAVCEGPEGGPFSPAGTVYQLRNVADYAIDYQVTHNPPVDWVTIGGALSGTLAPDQTAEVTVELNDNAESLTIGAYSNTIQFVNVTDHVGDTTRQVMLEVGRYVFNCPDVPQTIDDYLPIESHLTVMQPMSIADLDVDVDLTHTYIGDLVVSLESPHGTVVTLHNRSGGSSNDIVQCYDDEELPPDGPGAMADFDEQSTMGTWTLTVADEAGGDQGTLNGWSLRILPAGPTCDQDINGDSVVDAADLAMLLGNWGFCVQCPTDLDGNGIVNAADLALLLGAWGPCQ